MAGDHGFRPDSAKLKLQSIKTVGINPNLVVMAHERDIRHANSLSAHPSRRILPVTGLKKSFRGPS